MKCKLCGGNAGQLNDNGVHWLCEARKNLNQPTPCLGIKCPDCNGVGTQGKGGGMLFLDIGPAKIQQSINAIFPPCPTCKGRGYNNALDNGTT